MNTIATLLLAALCAAAGTVHADDTVHYRATCKSKKDCPVPPVPPVAPVAPMAPMAPVPPGASDVSSYPAPPAPPAPPALPALPAPPAPPPPPLMPEAPKAAHAACATKKEGASLTFSVGKGKTMAGYCSREHGKMVFIIEAYHSES